LELVDRRGRVKLVEETDWVGTGEIEPGHVVEADNRPPVGLDLLDECALTGLAGPVDHESTEAFEEFACGRSTSARDVTRHDAILISFCRCPDQFLPKL